MRRWKLVIGLLAVAASSLALQGCRSNNTGKEGGSPPVFTLAWSGYPSWSVFGVAAERGLIDGEAGKLGPIEKKWGVDIKLRLLDYEACIPAYMVKNCDAVCITNMDILNPSLSRNSVAVLPTSTSVGADACLVVGIDVKDTKKAVKELRSRKVHGLRESVSQYVFERNLELLGEKPSDYQFSNMDPWDAARQMQAKAKDVEAIMVWNPMTLQTLKSRPDARVLFDSSTIPEEVIDMVVVGEDVLKKPGGKEFACAVIDLYYQFNRMLADEKQRDGLLVDLGKKFSSLDLEEMKKACEQTRFYKTPEAGMALFTGEQFPKSMKTVTDFSVSHKIIKDNPPRIGFGGAEKAPDAQLRFDPTFMKQVSEKK